MKPPTLDIDHRELNLGPNQIDLRQLPNNHYLKESYQSNNYCFWNEYISDTLVESGTYFGAAVLAALTKGVRVVHTIEIDKVLYNYNVEKMTETLLLNGAGSLSLKPKHATFNIRNLIQVNYYLGDSCEILPQLLPQLNTQLSFWLDGHVSSDTGIASTASLIGGKEPLFHELDIIKNHSVKNHIIFIDIDSPDNWDRLDEIKSFIKSINPHYTIEEIPRFYFDNAEKVKEYKKHLQDFWGTSSETIKDLQEFWEKGLPEKWDKNIVLRAFVGE